MNSFTRISRATILAASLLFISMFTVLPVISSAASTSFAAPTAVDGDHDEWSNAVNAMSSNDVYATETTEDDDQSFENFGFTIPTLSVIDGIEVRFEGHHTDATGCEAQIRMWSDSDNEHTDYRVQNVTASDATYTLGSASDLWGSTWEAEDFSNANFHAEIRFDDDSGSNCSAGTFSLDLIEVNVHYTAPHTITTASGVGGTMTPAGPVSVADGADQDFDVTPASGYIVADVSVDAVSQNRINAYTFNNVAADHSISVSFESGWSQPASNSNNSGVGDATDAYTSNNADADFDSDGDTIEYGTFGYSVPANAIIQGVEVALEGARTSTRTLAIELSWDGGTTWTTAQPVAFASSDTTVVVGGPADTWSRAWAPAEFGDANFKVRVTAGNESGNLDVDQLQTKLTYILNTAPVAANDAYSGAEDTQIASDVTINDTDTDSDPLTVTVVDDVDNGILNLNPDGTFTYDPNGDYNGSDSFTYTVNDGYEDSNVATVSITVNSVNDAPSISSIPVTSGDSTVLYTYGITTTDVDTAGSDLDITSPTLPAWLTLSDNGDGTATLSGTPAETDGGLNSVVLRVTDNTTLFGEQSFDIVVSTAPMFDSTDHSQTVNEGATVTFTAVATDSDGDTLTYSLNGAPAGASINSSTGEFTWVTTETDDGIYPFDVVADDGNGDTDSTPVTLTVDEVNELPTANALPLTTDEELAVVGTLTATDNDDPAQTLSFATSTDPLHGTVSGFNSATGDFTYTPAADYSGSDSFDFVANDGVGNSIAATVTITISPLNDAPTFTSSAVTNATADDVYTYNIVTADVDGDALTITAPTLPAWLTSFTDNLDGTATLTGTPTVADSGPHSVTLNVSDGSLNTDQSFTITVSANHVPVVVDDAYSVNEDAGLTVVVADGVLDNDTDADSDPITAALVTDVTNGTLTLNADGSFTYSPDGNFNGTDSFTYKANDGTADSATNATVTITVNPVDESNSGGGGGGGGIVGLIGQTTVNPSAPANGGGQVLGAATFNFQVNFGFGSKIADVTELQKILIAEGFLKIAAPTGYFGPLTKAAVVKYQQAHGVTPTSGYVGPKTRAVLNGGVDVNAQLQAQILQLQAQLKALLGQ